MSRYPSHLSPNITPTKSGKAQKSRARREPSGVFSLFQPQQIQQFKEAFSLIDQDRDGLIGERDLKDTFASLGAYDKRDLLAHRIFIIIVIIVLCILFLATRSRNRAVPRNNGRAAHVAPGRTWLATVFFCCG